MNAILVLEDGSSYSGKSFGREGEVFGEIVFNTAMSGYQEILTDPSYHGQIVTMTYPLIGNYGINGADVESSSPKASGFVIKELSGCRSSWRSEEDLTDYLARNNIVGIEGVDTRSVVLRIREKGAMKAVISTKRLSPDELRKDLAAFPGIEERDLVDEVSCRKPFPWSEEARREFDILTPLTRAEKHPFKIAVFDYGIKFNILRILKSHFDRVEAFPFDTPASKILESKADGVFLSNGPGDPARLEKPIAEIKKLVGKVPIFGICLGHQLLGHAAGGKTFKLKFGHHGANHPVKDLTTGVIEITSQNHNYAVSEESIKRLPVEVTHINLNDHTIEGLRFRNDPVFCVQYHPESAPGPHDSRYLFERFAEMIKEAKGA